METNAYSTWLEVDLGVIKRNLQAVKAITHAEVMAVIKANGYGHGVSAVAEAVTEAGASWLGVARMEEAINLRQSGITAEIMVLGYTSPVMIPEAIHHRIHVAIYDHQMARAYAAYANQTHGQLKAHLKVETGMGRLGMPVGEVTDFLCQKIKIIRLSILQVFLHILHERMNLNLILCIIN